jgi:hypothetical protein
MTTTSFARAFWLACFPTAALFLFSLHLAWMPHYLKLRPPMDPPVWGKTYVALYDFGSSHGNVDYYIFHTGILGFRQRMAKADLLIFGSSHVQFGISAAQLGEKLSAAERHPVRVFNAAVSGMDMGIIRDIIDSNNIHDQAVLFDLFALYPPDPQQAPNFMVRALTASDLEAYIQVAKCWSEYWSDRFLDGLLPNVRIGNPTTARALELRRFLKITVIRDLRNGDAISFWEPSLGLVFPKSARSQGEPINNGYQPYGTSVNGGIGTPLPRSELAARHLQAMYMLVPFSGYTVGTIPAEATPFIPIATDGLFYWDGTHLTGLGREVATENLFEGLKKLGFRFGSPASSR